MYKKIVWPFILFIAFFSFAQNKKQVLLSIDGQPVYQEEFKRVFSKNLDLVEDPTQNDLNNYLKLFIDYKLKVLEAEAQGLDTVPSFVGEYNIYKRQLADKYMRNSKITEKLLKEAYARLQQEVNASHILINVSPGAKPADTLKAYNKLQKARKEIESGKPFESVAKRYSEDPSVEKNNGKLGWFSVFQMVYPFENAAYQTPVGQISKPVRSEFGYHLVKVNDKRDNLGSVEVAHIMLEDSSEKGAVKKSQIEEIYNKLQDGADFHNLAKQFSDDKNTAINGGRIRPFTRGALNSDIFESEAFALTNKGDFSKPFKTQYGWHIVKLLNKTEIGSLEDEEKKLSFKIKNDSRSQLINEKLVEKIRQTYSVQENAKALQYFQNNVGEELMRGNYKANLKQLPKKQIIAIKSTERDYTDFAKYIEARQKRLNPRATKNVVLENWLTDFKNAFLIEYHKKNLAKTNPEYANIIEEYRNGLLLFDLMEKNVWKAAKKDSLALKKYYKKHKDNYVAPKQIDAIVATANSEKTAKALRKALRKEEDLQKLTETYPSVIFKRGEFQENSNVLPQNFKAKKGVSKIYTKNGNYVVVKVKAIIPEKQENFEEAKGQVITAYQNKLEKEFLEGLRKKHSVKVNQEVFKNLKENFAR